MSRASSTNHDRADSQPIVGVSTSVTAFVGRTRRGPLDRPVPVTSMAEFSDVFGGLWNESPLSFAVRHFFENGGQIATIARAASPDATELTAGGAIVDAHLVPPAGASGHQGIHLLAKRTNFDLLVVPPPAWDQSPAASTWAAAAAFCLERRAFLLIDLFPGSGVTASAGVSELQASLPRTSPEARHAACFFPRVIARNDLTGKTQAFAPAGAIAGLMARTDANAGVWASPAGNEAVVRGAIGLDQAPSSGEIADLNALGVNCLRTLPAIGTVLWSARTWQGADGVATDWRYLAVRRLALYLEKSIDFGTRWAAFEPNDEPLWARLRLSVESFLLDHFRRGAFQGQTPREAFFARCGADTTTQHDIEQGIVHIQVGFAPLRPAEFVTISIRQRTRLDED